VGTFAGETAEFYARFRRGYPADVVDTLVERLGIRPDDRIVDLGCGTGLLTRPLALRAGAVLGVDPEPDMLVQARKSGNTAINVSWMLGADTDVVAIRRLLGEGSVAALTVGQALHLMDPRRLFSDVRPLLRDGGGVAVLSNGIPLWAQDSVASKALHGVLEAWLHTTLTSSCGTSRSSQDRYTEMLTEAGFEVSEFRYDYTETLNLDEVIGGLYSALGPGDLPTGVDRPRFEQQVEEALERSLPFIQTVPVVALIGRLS
jgi:trans-aconitate methyltransferase